MRNAGHVKDALAAALGAVVLTGALIGGSGAFEVGEARAVGADRVGTVAAATGLIRHRRDGSLVWREAEAGMEVHAGDALFTPAGTEARVRLDSGGEIELSARAMVVLPSRGPDAARVVRGRVWGEHAALLAAGREVRGRDGTEIFIDARDADHAVIDIEGPALVQRGSSIEELPAGGRQELTPSGTRAATVRRIRLQSPSSGQRLVAGERSSIGFSWQPVSGADAPSYVLRIARDPDLEELVIERTTPTHEAQLELAPGPYYWQVSAGDATSAPRKLVVTAAGPPRPLRPAAGAEILAEHMRGNFQWSKLPGAESYQFELASAARWDSPMLATRTDETSLRYHGRIPVGHYCYRVRARGHRDTEWSKPACFDVVKKRRLRAPDVLAPQIETIEEGDEP